jgi:hypothetical protein
MAARSNAAAKNDRTLKAARDSSIIGNEDCLPTLSHISMMFNGYQRATSCYNARPDAGPGFVS